MNRRESRAAALRQIVRRIRLVPPSRNRRYDVWVTPLIYLGRIGDLHAIIWVAVTIAGWSGLARLLFRAPEPFGRLQTYGVALSVILSTFALGWSIRAFTILHGHPLVQYNEPNSDVWHSWTRTWPYLFFGLPIGGLVMLALKRIVPCANTAGMRLAVWLALVQTVVSWVSVFANFPSA